MPTSANFGWNIPVVGGSSGAWGTLLNDFVLNVTTGLDKVLNDVKTTADAALARSGGVMTGEIDTLTQVFTEVRLGNLGATPSFDVAAGDFFSGTVDQAAVISIANPPADQNVAFIMIELTNPGAFALTWPASFVWPGGTEPSWTVAGVDVVAAYSRDGGVTWRAARTQENSS